MNLKLILSVLSIFCFTNTFAQNTPSYPQPKEGFKRVDLIFPKIETMTNTKLRFVLEWRLSYILVVMQVLDSDQNF